MKTLLIILLSAAFLGCDRYHYEQEVRINTQTREVEFCTWVWDDYENDMIYYWRDPLEDMNPELICRRQFMADSLIKDVNAMHNQKCK